MKCFQFYENISYFICHITMVRHNSRVLDVNRKKCLFSKQGLLIFLTSSENAPIVAFSTKISHKYLSVNHLGQYCLSHVGISAIKSKAPMIEY